MEICNMTNFTSIVHTSYNISRFHGDTWGISALSHWEDFVVGTYISFIVCTSILMNSLILFVLYQHRSRLMFTDYFIVSLAITDLGSPLFAYPMACTSSYSHKWLYKDIGCQINGFLGFYFGICGMETLAVMSFVRYIKICHRRYAARLNDCWTYYMIIAIYVSCAIIAGCPFFSWGEYDLEIFGTSCSVVWRKRDWGYIAFIMITCLVIPFFVMCASYVGIVRVTRCYAKASRSKHAWSKSELRLVKTTLFMCIAFVSAWMPYAVISMLNVLYDREVVTEQISIVPHLVAKSSHLLNPVVYFFMNNKYQRYVVGMVRRMCNCKKEAPEETRMTSGGELVSSSRPRDKDVEMGKINYTKVPKQDIDNEAELESSSDESPEREKNNDDENDEQENTVL